MALVPALSTGLHSKLLVRGDSRAAYHNHVLQHCAAQVRSLAPDAGLKLETLGEPGSCVFIPALLALVFGAGQVWCWAGVAARVACVARHPTPAANHSTTFPTTDLLQAAAGWSTTHPSTCFPSMASARHSARRRTTSRRRCCGAGCRGMTSRWATMGTSGLCTV